jgi:hypothetical protein
VVLITTVAALAQPPASKEKENWAESLLKDDPLAEKRDVTLADLEAALKDPKQRETVVERHFARASINLEEQKKFLKLALGTDSPVIQLQALDQMTAFGLLEEVVAEIVLEMAEQGDAGLRKAVMIALQDFDWDILEPPVWYRELIQQAMTSDDAREREAATRQIVAWGTDSVPGFLQILRSGTSSQREQAALALSRFLSAKRAQPGAAASAPPPTDLHCRQPWVRGKRPRSPALNRNEC